MQQNTVIDFSFTSLTLLGILQAVTSIISTLLFDALHHRFPPLTTKTLFQVTNLFSILIPAWGCLPLLFPRQVSAGYNSLTSLIGYNLAFGLFQAPYYAYSQSMMAELTPSGYEGLFFGLFGTMNRASSVLGPNVLYWITEGTGDRTWGFVFLTALCAVAGLMVCFVNVEKGRSDCREFVDVGEDMQA
ncbi:hypothetical protein ANO11243_062740 [Dothideomycetidae sp. 11243]|nr:hypothetical protein ANO11243_062740 [fungal sp. No.11243]